MRESFDYYRLKNWRFPIVEQSYNSKDSMLYALSAGYGVDLSDPRVLGFVYEKNLKAVPTMAVVLGYPGFWFKDPASGIDWVQLVHGEQNLHIHQPLPAEGTILGASKVVSVTDKGKGKGILVVFETEVSDKATGQLLATVSQATFCRAEGGYSETGQPSDVVESIKINYPNTKPDYVCDFATREEMALIYRLISDMNPLHVDAEVAQQAGFEQPILHGLATYAVAGRALIKACCDYNAERLEVMNARFSAPVYPGETIRTEIWKQGEREYIFRVSVLEREIVVLNNGYCRLRAE